MTASKYCPHVQIIGNHCREEDCKNWVGKCDLHWLMFTQQPYPKCNHQLKKNDPNKVMEDISDERSN